MVSRQGDDVEEGWAGLRANRKVRMEDRTVLRQRKEAQAIGLASQSYRKVMDRLVIDRQDRSKQADERWYPSKPCSVDGILWYGARIGYTGPPQLILSFADLRLQPGTSLGFDKFGDPVVALTPDTSGTEPSVGFMSSTMQSGGQRTRGMNRVSS